MLKKIIVVLLLLGLSSTAGASLLIPMFSMRTGQSIGCVKADDTIYGVVFTPLLHHLSPGIHGFHVHQCSSCAHQGEAAIDHLGMQGIGLHNGPYKGNSHLGDLPVLIVNARGKAQLPVLAPRIKLENIKGHTLMIDAGGDNYSDTPRIDGGGAYRIACGEIPIYNQEPNVQPMAAT